MNPSAAPARSARRYGQLTYSSFDAGRGTGGWQVKQVQHLSDDERERLVGQIVTQLDAGPVDPFPTPEAVAAMPRRLSYRRVPSGGCAYWHTAPAGVDTWGRPGNVFVHVLLDRAPGTPDPIRPVDLWRSPGWLTPYNPEEVVRAELAPDDRPVPKSADPLADVLQFLFDPDHWRLGVLPALLDATALALDGGPPVVLGVTDADQAAAWIASVSHLMAPGTARRLYFSTFERAGTVGSVAAGGAHIVCVPREDLDELPDATLTVVDQDEVVQSGSLGGEPHVTERGSRIPVTAWSGLAEAVLSSPHGARRVLDEMAHVAARLSSQQLTPAWPLAVAVLRHRDEHPDALEDAAVALLGPAPSLQMHPDLAEVVTAGVRDGVGSRGAAEAWAYLQMAQVDPSSETGRIVVEVYLERAVREPRWLTQPGGVPLPALAEPTPVRIDGALADEAVANLRERGRNASPQGVAPVAVECLRMADLLQATGQLDATPETEATDRLRLQVEAELERLVIPVLTVAAEAGPFLQVAGPLHGSTITRLLGPLLEQVAELARGRGHPLGSRLPSATVALVTRPQPSGPAALSNLTRRSMPLGVLEAEAVMHAYRAARSAGHGPTWASTALAAAVEDALSPGGLRDLTPFADLIEEVRPSVQDLLGLTRRFGRALPPELCLATLKSEPGSRQLADLCEALAPAAWRGSVTVDHALLSQPLGRLVWLRSVANGGTRWWAADVHTVYQLAARIDAYIEEALTRVFPGVDLVDDVLVHGQAAWLVTLPAAGFAPAGAHAARADPRITSRLARGDAAVRLLDIVGTLFLTNPIRSAALAALSAPGCPVALPSLGDLSSLRVEVDGLLAPVLDHVVQRQLGSRADVSSFIRGVVAQARGLVELEHGAASPAVLEFVQDHIRALAPKQGARHAISEKFRRG